MDQPPPSVSSLHIIPPFSWKGFTPANLRHSFRFAKTALFSGLEAAVDQLFSNPHGPDYSYVTAIKRRGKPLHIIADPRLADAYTQAIDQGKFGKPINIVQAFNLFPDYAGIFTDQPAAWKEERQTLEHPMLDITPEKWALIGKEAERLVDKWAAGKGTNDLVHDVRTYALRNFAHTVLHYDVTGKEDELAEAAEILNRHILRATLVTELSSYKSRKVLWAERFMRDFIIDVCRSKTGKESEQDVVADILRKFDAFDNPSGPNLSQAYEKVYHLMIAGFETTTTFLTHLFANLAKHQEAQETLRREFHDRIKHGMPLGHPVHLNEMESFMRETLRLNTPVNISFVRQAREKVCLGGVLEVEAGDDVIVDLHKLHQSLVFGQDAAHFCPHRTASSKASALRKEHHMFGSGGNTCLGQFLVRAETLALLTRVLDRLTVEETAGPIDEQQGATRLMGSRKIAMHCAPLRACALTPRAPAPPVCAAA